MVDIKDKILVVVDPTSKGQAAVERAAELAEYLGTGLELFICHEDADSIKTLRNKLEDLAVQIRNRGLQVDIDIACNHSLTTGIVDKVLASTPWMVVKDTHHHNVLQRTFLSNTDWTLIRECSAPLLLVKQNTNSALQKICAAIDPMHKNDKTAELDHKIFGMAEILTKATGAELHLVHTFAVQSEPVGLEAPSIGSISEIVSREHQNALSEFLRSHSVSSSNVHLLQGVAYKRLVDFTVKEEIDLIVMGAVSRSNVERILIGSTAERMLERLSCNLLIVKQERKRSA